MFDAFLRILFVAVLMLPAVGCAVVEREVAPADELGQPFQDAETTAPAEDVPEPSEVSDVVIPLEVVEAPQGSTLVFVPVFIRGEGPFSFALDTGASDSVLDQSLTEELGLQAAGDPREVTGVTGGGEAQPVEIDEWTIGDLPLEPQTASSLPLALAEGTFRGLLGSDVLSRFGAVIIDYEREELVLRPRRQADS